MKRDKTKKTESQSLNDILFVGFFFIMLVYRYTRNNIRPILNNIIIFKQNESIFLAFFKYIFVTRTSGPKKK